MADVKEILVHWDAGVSISGIAQTLGYSRPTVRKYVQAAAQAGLVRGSRPAGEAAWERLARAALGQVAPLRRPGEASTRLAAYHAYLGERVGQVRLSVLHQRLRDEQQRQVSWATFYRYVRQHWPERVRPAPRVTVRLTDPPPGEEAQLDYFYVGRWEDPETGRRHRLSAFLFTLSHSRHQFLYPVLREDAAAWLDAPVAAFAFLGGTPRRVVPDNLGAAIRRADRYDPRVNRAYGELVRYDGCLVDPARVRRPTDKPRVERGVDFARHSFFAGRTFPSLAGMRREAARWCVEVAGQRVHGTTGERPFAAFLAREQAALLPLPPVPWEPVTWLTVRVQADCHIQAAQARYSVPHPYVGQRLDVRLGRATVEIYAGAELVVAYLRRAHGHTTRLEHYPTGAQAFLRATPAVCQQRAAAIGAATDELVRDLLMDRTRSHLREVQAVLRLVDAHGPARLEQACRRARAVGDGRYRTVRGLLERGLEAAPLDDPDALATPNRDTGRAFLRGPAAFARALGEGR